MRARVVATVASALLTAGSWGCSAPDPGPSVSGIAPPVAAPTTTIARADVERDLRLELRRTSSDGADDERDLHFEVWLVNQSSSRGYPVVLANDGSEMGWREPHAFFDVELLRPNGSWEPPPPFRGARCGNYAEDWTKDVVTLAPGAKVKMPWMPYAAPELGDATRVRVTARYVYGESARDKSKVPPILHPMPSYAIASAPMEIPIERPYTLEVRVKGPLPAKPGEPLASAIDVVVANRSRATLPVGTPETGAQLWFEAVFAKSDGSEDPHDLFTATTPTFPSEDRLAAGARRSIVTAATKTDVVWSVPPDEKLLRIRAMWRIWDRDVASDPESSNVHRVASPWTTP